MKKIFLIIFIILFILLGILVLLFTQLYNRDFRESAEKVSTKSTNTVKLQKRNTVELFNKSLDDNCSYSCVYNIDLDSNDKKYEYEVKEEYSPNGLVINNENFVEYVEKDDKMYTHYLKFNDEVWRENINANDLSVFNQLKSAVFKEESDNKYIVYSTTVNAKNTYIYELHDFIRMITTKSSTKLSGTATIKYFFSKDDSSLEKVEIDALDIAKNSLDTSDIDNCKIIITNPDFVKTLNFALPEEYESTKKLKDEYKDFEPNKSKKNEKETTKPTKPTSSFKFDTSLYSFTLNSRRFRIGSSTIRDVVNSGLDVSYSENSNYAISNSKDYIQFSYKNPYDQEVSAEDCVISGLYYINNGYNEITSIGSIYINSSIDIFKQKNGEPMSVNDGWYTWSNNGSISLYAPNDIVLGFQL